MWLLVALYRDATWAILATQVASRRQAGFVEEPCVCVCMYCMCTLAESCDISLCSPTDMGGMLHSLFLSVLLTQLCEIGWN